MHGLDLTYRTLATTRNTAAVNVLLQALKAPDASTRQRAMQSLASRRESCCGQMVLSRWDRIQPEDLGAIRSNNKWLVPAIEQALCQEVKDGQDGQDVKNILRAIEAARALELYPVFPTLIDLAQVSGHRPIRRAATEVVLELVEPLGRQARLGRDQLTTRNPIAIRLANSVRHFSWHRNKKMLDAFLAISSCSDSELRTLLDDASPRAPLLVERLAVSQHPGVTDLLSGFLRQQSLPRSMADLLKRRADSTLRQSLLRVVGNEPSLTVLKNLRAIGMPASCCGGEPLLAEIKPEDHAALAHMWVTAGDNPIQTLEMLTAIARAGSPGSELPVATGLMRCAVPEAAFWIDTAKIVADQDAAEIHANAKAKLLKRLIDLLDHPHLAIVRGVRRILGPLHTDQILPKLSDLSVEARHQLGRLVMMIDPLAIDRIRAGLHHTVLEKRLEAIVAADAFAVIDLLSDSLAQIAHHDNQQARVQAAEMISNASSQTTFDLLEDLASLPESQVRDAAIKALRTREQRLSTTADS